MTTIHIHSETNDLKEEITRLRHAIIHKNVLNMFDELHMLYQLQVLTEDDFAEVNEILRSVLSKVKVEN
jgi:hypothetical protein